MNTRSTNFRCKNQSKKQNNKIKRSRGSRHSREPSFGLNVNDEAVDLNLHIVAKI